MSNYVVLRRKERIDALREKQTKKAEKRRRKKTQAAIRKGQAKGDEILRNRERASASMEEKQDDLVNEGVQSAPANQSVDPSSNIENEETISQNAYTSRIRIRDDESGDVL